MAVQQRGRALRGGSEKTPKGMLRREKSESSGIGSHEAMMIGGRVELVGRLTETARNHVNFRRNH